VQQQQQQQSSMRQQQQQQQQQVQQQGQGSRGVGGDGRMSRCVGEGGGARRREGADQDDNGVAYDISPEQVVTSRFLVGH
jgi:hypothetical protein